MIAYFAFISGYQIVTTSRDLGRIYDTTPVVEEFIPVTIGGKIEYYADKYNVSEYVVNTVIKCESNYNPKAIGDSGNSRGLVQIHRPSHPHISDTEAFDPDFAIKFLAENLAKGDGWMWTCYRNNFS